MDVKRVYALPNKYYAPHSQLNSRLALSSGVFIPLQKPISPTNHPTLTFQTRIQIWISVKYLVRTEQENTFRFGYKHQPVNDLQK
jgi:hypothetical protein